MYIFFILQLLLLLLEFSLCKIVKNCVILYLLSFSPIKIKINSMNFIYFLRYVNF